VGRSNSERATIRRKKKNRPLAEEWFWAEVLRTLPKAEAKFRKEFPHATLPSSHDWSLGVKSILYLASKPDVIMPVDAWLREPEDSLQAEIQKHQIELHKDFADFYRFFPDYTLFLMRFVRQRIGDIKRQPVREFLLRRRGGHFLAVGKPNGRFSKALKALSLPGLKLTPVSLQMPRNMTFEQWLEVGKALAQLSDAANETESDSQLHSILEAEEKQLVDAIERESGKRLGERDRKEIYHAVRQELRRLSRLPKPEMTKKTKRKVGSELV
jgi:hypothetical protein